MLVPENSVLHDIYAKYLSWKLGKKIIGIFFNVLIIEFQPLGYFPRIVIVNFGYFIMFLSGNALLTVKKTFSC